MIIFKAKMNFNVLAPVLMLMLMLIMVLCGV